jgi:hypothetical protein
MANAAPINASKASSINQLARGGGGDWGCLRTLLAQRPIHTNHMTTATMNSHPTTSSRPIIGESSAFVDSKASSLSRSFRHAFLHEHENRHAPAADDTRTNPLFRRQADKDRRACTYGEAQDACANGS